jgi:quercetin dioxygenase-like cupin family protein
MSTEAKQATTIAAGQGRQLNVLGHTVNVMLGGAETRGDSFVFETISPPGLFVPPHVHQHEDEYGYIIEGVFEVLLDGRTYEAGAGAIIHCPRRTSHGFRNVGPTPGRMIWLSTPGAQVERFFDELGALPADAPPDMQKVVGIFTKYDIQVLPLPGTWAG